MFAEAVTSSVAAVHVRSISELETTVAVSTPPKVGGVWSAMETIVTVTVVGIPLRLL